MCLSIATDCTLPFFGEFEQCIVLLPYRCHNLIVWYDMYFIFCQSLCNRTFLRENFFKFHGKFLLMILRIFFIFGVFYSLIIVVICFVLLMVRVKQEENNGACAATTDTALEELRELCWLLLSTATSTLRANRYCLCRDHCNNGKYCWT